MKPNPPIIQSDSHEGRLTIVFPHQLVSTNVDEMREGLRKYYDSVDNKLSKWKKLEMDFKGTEFVDSMGLNLVFDLVKLAEDQGATIVAWLTSRAVRLTFYTVRLDKKMDIRLVENADGIP